MQVQAEAAPLLDELTRAFVKRSLDARLLELEDIKKVVASLLAANQQFTPESLAQGLMGAGLLTKWQAAKLLAGKSGGFYLGSYKLLRPLGKGGMGVVYLAEHHVMKRLMALKILPPEASADRRRIELFKSEARACAQLDHPNIVRAYDFAESGEKLYIVMEYVDGIDMHQTVQRDGVMTVADTIDALVQATLGLAHAHERGIVHRDIKPSNFLVRTDGVVKLSDLGLARMGVGEAGEPVRKKLMGTTDFISPEQAINGKTVDCTADIYSLGCTVFYMLTGRPPFTGTAAERLAKHQTIPIPDVRKWCPDCPQLLVDLIERMTAKRPQDRPKSAVELLSQVQRLTPDPISGSSRKIGRQIAAASDTVVDGSLAEFTFEDSSIASDTGMDALPQLDELDFSNLQVNADAVNTKDPFQGVKQFPSQNHVMPVAKTESGSASGTTNSTASTSQQTLLLGFGLAVAIMALIAVLVAVVYAFIRPVDDGPIRMKATESGKKIIIVDQ
ncbi:MAG: serine/threonine-protein kinase [Rubripirellula sp.]